jgi:hypothetical protein
MTKFDRFFRDRSFDLTVVYHGNFGNILTYLILFETFSQKLMKCPLLLILRRWQARQLNFTPSQLTALKSTDSLKLASIAIRNYVKMPKMPIFRHSKMHVRIKLET